MFCPSCGTEAVDGAKFCGHCGQKIAPAQSADAIAAVRPLTASPEQPDSRHAGLPIGLIVAIGALAGGFLGFVMRPSVMLIGQLPFETVVTRGATLSGLDQLLVPAAQQSFNALVLGTLIGAVAGFGLHRLLAKGNA